MMGEVDSLKKNVVVDIEHIDCVCCHKGVGNIAQSKKIFACKQQDMSSMLRLIRVISVVPFKKNLYSKNPLSSRAVYLQW